MARTGRLKNIWKRTIKKDIEKLSKTEEFCRNRRNGVSGYQNLTLLNAVKGLEDEDGFSPQSLLTAILLKVENCPIIFTPFCNNWATLFVII